MAYSYNDFGSKSPGDTITVGFPFEERSHVSVTVGGTPVATNKWSWLNDSLISCLAGFPAGTGRVLRTTPADALPGELIGTAVLDYPMVNANFDRTLYILQEKADGEADRQAQIVELGAEVADALDVFATSLSAANAARDTAITKASEAGASATSAATQATNAAASAVLAQQWAANPEDVVVSGSLYSALHYAAKAAASAVSAAAAIAFTSTLTLAAANVPAATQVVQVQDYAVAGDAGGHRRKRVALQPAWGGIRSQDRFLPNGTTDNTNGGWWDVDEAAPNELMFGGVSSNTNAVQTAAIQAMMDYCYANPGRKATIVRSHTVTAQLNVPAGLCLEFGWGFPSAVFGQGCLIKGFNGDMIRLGDASMLIRPLLQGVGASFTGRGVVIDQGNDQVILHPFINDMNGPCIEFPTGGVGGRFRCEGGYFLRSTITDPCIVMPAAEVTTFGYRIFNNPGCGGGTLFAFKNGNMTQVTGGFSAGVDFTGNTTGRVFLSGHRVASALTTIEGTQHHINHCSFGGSVTLAGTASEVDFSGNILSGTITLNSGAIKNDIVGNHSTTGNAVVDNSAATGANINNVDDPIEQSFTPAWTGSITNPAIGNGSMQFFWKRSGRSIRVRGRITMGSTTTYGSGIWSLGLPTAIPGVTSNGRAVGAAQGLDTGTAYIVGACFIADGGTVINMNHHGGSNLWGQLIPQTWAIGDEFSIDITIALK